MKPSLWLCTVSTIQDTRSLIFEFSSPVLYELGFVPAVEWLAERMEELYGVSFEIRDDEHPKPLDDDVAVGMFQAVRELRPEWSEMQVLSAVDWVRSLAQIAAPAAH